MARLARTLTLARLRWIIFAVVRALLVATAVACSVVLSTLLARWAGVVPPVEARLLFLFTALPALLALTGVLTWSLARLPSLAALATRCDRRFGLYDRLGTALELARRPSGSLTLVEAAAVEDATSYAHALRPSQVVPFRWPAWSWAVPLLVSTALAGTLFGPPAPPPSASPPVVSGEDRSEDPDEPGVTTAAVRQVAAALASDEEAEQDPYLGAVARELQAFAEGLEGEEVDDPARAAELDRLLDHLERATASREDTVGRLLHDLAETGLRVPTSPEVPEAPAATEAQEPEVVGAEALEQPPEGIPETTRLSVPSERKATSVPEMLDELARAVEELAAEASQRGPGLAAAGPDCDAELHLYGGICQSESEARRQPSGLVQEGEAAGEPVGAARTADDRAGDAAGDGGQPDETVGGGDEPAGVEGEVERMQLPDAGIDTAGAHYEVQGVPDTEAGRASPIEAVQRLAAHRAEEGAMSRQSIGRSYHQVVRRYFLPDALEADVSPTPER